MSDFLIDTRPAHLRRCESAAQYIKFFPETRAEVIHERDFSLALSRCDNPATWGHYWDVSKSIPGAVTGRVTCHEAQSNGTTGEVGSGGTACRNICESYMACGAKSLEKLNGNYVAIVCDLRARKIHIATDRVGAAPGFRCTADGGYHLFSSHPDLLAESIGAENDLDLVSISEFLCTGRVTPPASFYTRVQNLAEGSIHTLEFTADGQRIDSRKYFSFEYQPIPTDSPSAIADRLGEAFRRSISRRTSPSLGPTAVALSGGLDSRAILACCPSRPDIRGFCFFDEENFELSVAKQIARTFGFELLPFRREFDHYGSTAGAAIRVYGGMGSLVNNHFLTFRKHLQDLGFENVITGFYCDYMFKGLAQDRKKHKLLRWDTHTPYSHQWYRPVYWDGTRNGTAARSRLDSVFGQFIGKSLSQKDRFDIEKSRVFPLAYEADNAEATAPQRVMPWFLPTADNDILDVYQTIPPSMKLNASMYSIMVANLCGTAGASIPDANTGSPVNASILRQSISTNLLALGEKARKRLRPRMATYGSWPNWGFYVRQSALLKSLWDRPNPIGRKVMTEVLESDPFERDYGAWSHGSTEYFLRLLTVKIWLDVKGSSPAYPI